MLREYEIVEIELSTGERVIATRFNEDPFAGLVVSFNKVKLNHDTGHLEYIYHIHEEPFEEYNIDDLHKELGDFVLNMILEQLERNELIICGDWSVNDRTSYSNKSVNQ